MTEERKLVRRLTLAMFKIDEIYLLNQQKKAMKEAELCLMYALDDGQGHSQREIAAEWLIPRTTLNTIVKQWERDGLLTLTAIPGKRREMHITFTDAGRAHAHQALSPVYRAEEEALASVVRQYSDTFIDALEHYGRALRESLERLKEL